MRALSIRQPWAWLIVNGIMPVENRTWPTGYRGPLLIHASKTMTKADYQACEIFARSFGFSGLPPMAGLQRGGIVGQAVLTGCVEEHDSDWFCGPFGFVMANAKPLPFFECNGQLGWFDVPLSKLLPESAAVLGNALASEVTP